MATDMARKVFKQEYSPYPCGDKQGLLAGERRLGSRLEAHLLDRHETGRAENNDLREIGAKAKTTITRRKSDKAKAKPFCADAIFLLYMKRYPRPPPPLQTAPKEDMIYYSQSKEEEAEEEKPFFLRTPCIYIPVTLCM